MAKNRASILTTNLTYVLVCILSLCLVAGSFLLRVNFGEEATADARVIEYTYRNESKDPQNRNRFRYIRIKFSNALRWYQFDTKAMRVEIFREGDINDTHLLHGKIYGMMVEDLAKFRSVIFDYDRCVEETQTDTNITIYFFKRYEGDLALKTMVVNINRSTDKITIIGKELSAEDIWSNDLADPKAARKKISHDLALLQLLMQEKAKDERYKQNPAPVNNRSNRGTAGRVGS